MKIESSKTYRLYLTTTDVINRQNTFREVHSLDVIINNLIDLFKNHLNVMLKQSDFKVDVLIIPPSPNLSSFGNPRGFCGTESIYRIVIHKYCAEVYFQELLIKYFNFLNQGFYTDIFSRKGRFDTDIYQNGTFYPYPNQTGPEYIKGHPNGSSCRILYNIKRGNVSNFIIEDISECRNIDADIKLIERDIIKK